MKNKTFFLFIAGTLAYTITAATHQDIHAYPITKPLAPYAYRLLFAFLWPLLDSSVGAYVGSWLVWFVCLALLAFMVDEIGERLEIEVRVPLLAALAIAPAVVGLQPGGAFWNAAEAVFYGAGLLMILDGRKWALYPLVILATLNRETAVFIPLLYWLITKDWRHGLGLGLTWAAVYGAIRLIIGPLPLDLTLKFIFEVNIGVGLGRFALGLLMVVWLFWYAYKGWLTAPEPLRRAGLVIPAYLLLVAVFGIWHEWRLILSLYPLMIPLAGCWLGPPSTWKNKI